MNSHEPGSRHLIVLLSGKQGSGKSTVARDLAPFAMQHGFTHAPVRVAGPLYEMHDAIMPLLKRHGMRPQTCDKDGELLQLLGTEYGRKVHGPTVWTDICRRSVNALKLSVKPLLITIEDARFEEEFSAFPDAYRVRLTAPADVRKKRTHAWRENDTHPSEIGLDRFASLDLFDLYVDTNDRDRYTITKDLLKRAQLFARRGREIQVVRKLRLMKETA